LNQHFIPNTKRMNSLLRRSLIPALVACLALSARLSGADTPTAAPAPAASPAAAPAPAAKPTPKVVPFTLPKNLEGIVTLEEYEHYVKFTSTLMQQPEIKALNEQARAKMAELTDIRKQLMAAQQKAFDADPGVKATFDKIRKGKPRPAVDAAAAPATAPTAAPAAVVAPTPAKK
jgi:hypothetical protein